MARIIGTTGSAPKTVKVKAHVRSAPAEPSHTARPAKPAPVKVSKPSPTRIARQQEQGYASQGRAVQAQANRATHPAHPNTVQRAHEAEQQYRSQGRAVRRDATGQQYRAAVKEIGPAKHSGGGGGPLLASITPGALVHAIGNVDSGGSMPVFSGLAHVIGRGVKDAEEMAVTTPSSVAHLASTAVHHPEKVPGELAAPYKQLAEHPIKTLSEHPLQTALMVAPAVRMPGRALGKGLRVAGKQTLERPAASLPGTAMKVTRTGSRDAAVRFFQSRADRKNPTPTATAKDVQERVDARFDANRHIAQRAEAQAVRATKRAMKGQPKTVRHEAVAHARDQAREQAHQDAEVRFAREFGANVRLSTGAAERELAQRQRVQAVQRHTAARQADQHAKAAHDQALTNAKVAKAKAKTSPHLAALQTQRANAARAVVAEQKAATAAQLEHAKATGAARVSVAHEKSSPALKALQTTRRTAQQELSLAQKARNAAAAVQSGAKGRAEILSRNVGGGGRAGGHGIRLATDSLAQADERVRAAQGAIKDIDHRISAERKRIAGVAPAQQDRLVRAMEGRELAPVRVRTARQTVRALDQQIGVERQRISGVPPAEHQALLDAIHQRGQTRAELASARAIADAARTVHVQAKQGMAHASLVSPSGAGRLFTHRADAANVARKLNEQGQALKQGTSSPVRFQLHDPAANGAVVSAQRGGSATVPLEFTVRQVGEKWAAVPKVASHRMYPTAGPDSPLSHASVGASKSTMAKVMRTSRRAFTTAVLPFSAKWLAGQGGEAGLRAAVAGAGPADWLRIGKIVKQMNADRPGSGDEFRAAITGGHFDLTGPARDFADGKKTLAEEFAGTSLRQPAAAATYAGHLLPVRAVRTGFNAYSRAVMGVINGAIEQNARRAMAGQAVKNLGLIDHHLIGLTDAAIKDAADKLQHTENQFAAVKALNRMYGKYQGFSPEMRSLLLHWTPFLPWYLNVATFLFKVLPVDHPVTTALLADINAAEEGWRKQHNLSLLSPNHVPDFLLGSVPTGKGGSLRVAHYTPFGVGSDVTGALGSLALPQFEGPILNALGVDWKGSPLTVGGSHGKPFSPTQKAIRALVTAAEEQVPGVTQAGAISGVTPRYVDRSTPSSIKTPAQVLKGYLPTTPTSGGSSGSVQPLSSAPVATGRVRAVRVKPVAGARGQRVKAVRVKPVRVR